MVQVMDICPYLQVHLLSLYFWQQLSTMSTVRVCNTVQTLPVYVHFLYMCSRSPQYQLCWTLGTDCMNIQSLITTSYNYIMISGLLQSVNLQVLVCPRHNVFTQSMTLQV